MKSSYRTGVMAVASMMASIATAQYKCADYHRMNGKVSSDRRFSINGQSKSAMVQVGTETELNIVVYNGQDYRISVCHDEKILGEQLAIRLVEKIRIPMDELVETIVKEPVLDESGEPTGTTQEVKSVERKRIYKDEEKVLWDNTANDMSNEVEFTCTSTKRIAVEIVAPGNSDAKAGKGEPNDIGCVGILIEHMPTPPLGFEPR